MFSAARLLRAPVLPARVFARTYAAEASGASSGQLVLNFLLPHEVICEKEAVNQVNIASTSGDMGILADHVPTIQQLRPGVLEVIKAEGTQKWFVSGGFAIVNEDSSLNINAVEAFKLDDFSPEAIRDNLAAAQRAVSAGGSEQEVAKAKIEVEVLEALQAAVGKTA
ncbi:putative ATP synthase delta chain precursor, mitochondrial [Syncephalis pseudoplumigaleata]|uniref:ATP synthase subunit delta, mitochondrial n=1 Tax=Syncephalis pseudoplumigaleata TaxID=1712513 RepID=A0A4P9YT05_9FUNG|nr:putative ATP synthase delta chain precursor, mitochondrial [Syncephalis pseudoplumigaleata]|eukprot:RKP22532.1 putative ATP synthase delta chain precursor, mitochondrial [Syncephalis pseudoplumigaleata]